MKILLSAFVAAFLLFPAATAALTIEAVQVSGPSSAPARAVAPARSSMPAREVAPSSADAGAAVDVFIKIPDIDGESTESDGVEPDEIDLKADPEEAGADVFIKIPDIDGESEEARGIEPDEIDAQADPQEASGDYFFKLGGVEGETTKGNVPGVEPDEIDVAADPQPLTPDFGVLLGGGDADDRPSEENLMEAADILLAGMKEQGAPAETMSLNYEKIKTTARQSVKLFGFIPMTVVATVEVDAQGGVEVAYPWWAFLATGKDADSLGTRIVTALSNVLKTKHDVLKNAIGNVR